MFNTMVANGFTSISDGGQIDVSNRTPEREGNISLEGFMQ